MPGAIDSILDLPEYCTLYSQCFSPDGTFLAVGDNRGRIIIYQVSSITARSDHPQPSSPAKTVPVAIHIAFSAFDAPVFSLISSNDDLIVGSLGQIAAWRWKDLQKKNLEKAWNIDLQPLPGLPNEVNFIEFDDSVGTAGRLIVASGDNNLKVFDIETAQKLQNLPGHDNYIHW